MIFLVSSYCHIVRRFHSIFNHYSFVIQLISAPQMNATNEKKLHNGKFGHFVIFFIQVRIIILIDKVEIKKCYDDSSCLRTIKDLNILHRKSWLNLE